MTDNQKTTTGASTGAKSPGAVAFDTADTLKATAKNAVDTAREEVSSRAGVVKDSVAEEVSGVASALRTAAGEMQRGSPQERTFGQIAEGLADASEAIRNKDLGEVARDLSGFARRNPLIFLGGAALVGFAATRFAKATSNVETAAQNGGKETGQARSPSGMHQTSGQSRGMTGDFS